MVKGLKEHVRVLGKADRKGNRHLAPVATLVAFVDDGEVLVGYAKVYTGKDKFHPEYGADLAEVRAVGLKYRLEDYGLNVQGKGFSFVHPLRIDPKTGTAVTRIFPFVVQEALPAFLVRCEKYFKDTPLVQWAALVRGAMMV